MVPISAHRSFMLSMRDAQRGDQSGTEEGEGSIMHVHGSKSKAWNLRSGRTVPRASVDMPLFQPLLSPDMAKHALRLLRQTQEKAKKSGPSSTSVEILAFLLESTGLRVSQPLGGPLEGSQRRVEA